MSENETTLILCLAPRLSVTSIITFFEYIIFLTSVLCYLLTFCCSGTGKNRSPLRTMVKPVMSNPKVMYSELQTNPTLAFYLPDNQNFPPNGPLDAKQQLVFDLLRNLSYCAKCGRVPVRLLRHAMFRQTNFDRAHANIQIHATAHSAYIAAYESPNLLPSGKQDPSLALINATDDDNSEIESRAQNFLNLVKHFCPFARLYEQRIWHHNIYRAHSEYKVKYFSFGVYHEDWLALRRLNVFTDRDDIRGLYYPHFRTLDCLTRSLREPTPGVVDNREARSRIGPRQEADFDDMPDRLWLDDNY